MRGGGEAGRRRGFICLEARKLVGLLHVTARNGEISVEGGGLLCSRFDAANCLAAIPRLEIRCSRMHNKSHHQLWKVASAGIAACVLLVACKRTEQPLVQKPEKIQQPEQKPVVMRTIEGQVFIRTKGAETFKLSSVDVLIFDRKVIEGNLEKKRAIAQPLYDYLQPFVKQAEEENDRAYKARVAAIGKDDFDKIFEAELKVREKKAKLNDAANYTMSADYYFGDLPEALQMTKTDADGKFSFKVPSGSYVLAAFSSRKVGKETELYYWMVKVAADADKKVILGNDNLCSSRSADSVISALDFYCGEATRGGIHFVEAFVENDKRERPAAEESKKEAARKAQEAASKAQLAEAAKIEMERKAQAEKKEMERRNDPKAAKLRAIELYPDLGVVDSSLYTEFRERETIYRVEKKEFFREPDWPTRLAKECSEALAAKPKAK